MNEIKYDKKRLNEVKTILVTQPKPKEDEGEAHSPSPNGKAIPLLPVV